MLYIDCREMLSTDLITSDRHTATPEPTELPAEGSTIEILDDDMMSITGYVGQEASVVLLIVINGMNLVQKLQ